MLCAVSTEVQSLVTGALSVHARVCARVCEHVPACLHSHMPAWMHISVCVCEHAPFASMRLCTPVCACLGACVTMHTPGRNAFAPRQ